MAYHYFIFLFYSINPGTQLTPRYSIGYFLYQILFFVIIFSQKNISFNFFKKLEFQISFGKFFFGRRLIILTLVINFIILLPLKYIKDTRYNYSRIDNLAVGGQVVDYIFPKSWSIAITELNTFGFMNDRNIIDLWGYTNLEIAKSKIYSPVRNKINPNYFLEKKPDIFWFRTYNVNEVGYYYALKIPEKRATTDNMSKSTNNLGDMLKVIKYYDMYVLYHGDYETILFSKKSLKSEILDVLINKGFSLKSFGNFKIDLFKSYYQ